MLSCCCCGWVFYLILGGLAYAAYILIPKYILQKKLDRFTKENCPKDVVILHGVRRAKTIPAFSPFVLKLETFLRMAKIPYEYDGNMKNTFGPKGKTPWISLNGEHIADSELCIEFLSKKFEKTVKNNYSEKQLAIANLIRINLEDRLFWLILLWAFVWDGEGPKSVQRLMRLPWLAVKYFGYHYGKMSYAQGTGRHSKEDIVKWAKRDIKGISDLLGNNKYLLGDEPCVEDACVFGFCAQMFWGFIEPSPYAKYAQEFPNLLAYCNRMKEEFYPDWEQLLRK